MSENENLILTVFTPTYNRSGLLERVYQSLLDQTEKNFVWLIVDDGSTDNTRSCVEQWQKENRFPIRYEYRENGGKMRAHNTGVMLCATELFVCLDSDDCFTENAVEKIITAWKAHGSNKLSGIVAHKGENETTPLFRARFPEVEQATLRGLYRMGFSGETTLVFRTDILKKNLFPEIEGEKYVPEDYIYDKIDKEYELYVLPEILTLCEIVEGGYTKQAAVLRKQNPTGWFLYYEQRMVLEPWSLLKIKYISHYLCFARILGRNAWKEKKAGPLTLLLGVPGEWLLLIAGKM